MVDIAANNHDRADLRDGAPEASQYGGDQPIAAVPQKRCDDFRRGCSERTKLLAIFFEQILASLPRESSDDWGHKDDLGHDHRLWRIEELEHSERPGVGQEQV